MVKNPSCNAEDPASIHVRGTKIPQAKKQLSPQATAPESTAQEPQLKSTHRNGRSHMIKTLRVATKTQCGQRNEYFLK